MKKTAFYLVLLAVLVSVAVALRSPLARFMRRDQPPQQPATLTDAGPQPRNHPTNRTILAARNPKPRVRSAFEQRQWEKMTDRDREEQDAIDEAFEDGMVTRDFAEWRRLLMIRDSREPWENETRQEQAERLARGQTNYVVIEITNRTEKPLFVPTTEKLNLDVVKTGPQSHDAK